MKYPTVIVNGVSVRVDEDGRYNLNDLHAAAVANGEATEQQRPSQFLRSAQIKRFIKALEAKVQKSTLEQIQPLKIIKGGAEPGVWKYRGKSSGVLNFWQSDMQHGLSRNLKSKFMKFSKRLSVSALAQCPV